MLESEDKQFGEDIAAANERFKTRVAEIFAQERIDLDRAKRQCTDECIAAAKRFVAPDQFPNFMDDLIDACVDLRRAKPAAD